MTKEEFRSLMGDLREICSEDGVDEFLEEGLELAEGIREHDPAMGLKLQTAIRSMADFVQYSRGRLERVGIGAFNPRGLVPTGPDARSVDGVPSGPHPVSIPSGPSGPLGPVDLNGPSGPSGPSGPVRSTGTGPR